MTKASPKIAIVGAGLCGSLLAVYFAKRGMQVDVYEYRPDIRTVKKTIGRSINLALSCRGLTALQGANLADHVAQEMIPMKGRMIHLPGQPNELQPYGFAKDQVIHSISRRNLNQLLIEQADAHESITMHFGYKCTQYDIQNQTLSFQQVDSNGTYRQKYDYVLGTDGAFSKIRQAMMKQDRFNYEQMYIPHGYKELTMAPTASGDFAMDPNALHIWPRKSFMLIALPNLDRSFTCTLFMGYKSQPGFDHINTDKQIQSLIQNEFPDLPSLLPDYVKQFQNNPTSSLVTIYCSPWNVEGHTLLMGDASHAIVPFFGQGMNAAFEDVRLFFEYVDRLGDVSQSIEAFAQSRKKDADAIAQMALENFVEMRDAVSDPDYQQKRAIEQALEKQYPDQYQSRYAMVSFSNLPYSDAYQRGQENQKLLQKMISENIEIQNAESLLA